MRSLKDQLHKLIESRGQVSYTELVQYAMEEGYKADNMTRRMRELCNETGITPLTKKSRRNTDYIYAYSWNKPPEKPKPSIVFENGKAIMIMP